MTADPQRLLAICLDCGDTLIDEATEVKAADDVALRGELIPGADELVRELARRGYPLALVADGPAQTFSNLLGQHDLDRYFAARAISGQLGCAKPDPRMFAHALGQLGIRPEQYSRTLMLGNNLARDIRGANALGIISVWLDWAPRRAKAPADEHEVPRHIIRRPLELLDLIAQIEGALAVP